MNAIFFCKLIDFQFSVKSDHLLKMHIFSLKYSSNKKK